MGRLGEDEFTVFLIDIQSENDVISLSKPVLEAISRPYLKDGCEYQNSASIGIALFPQHGDSFQQLHKNADISLYRSQKMGKGKAAFYEE